MSFDAHANFAVSSVLTPPSPGGSGLSLTVQSGDGAGFPAVPFNATVWPASSQPTRANATIVRVTGISGDVLTFARSQEGSSNRTILTGDLIAATITKKTLTDIEGSAGSTVLMDTTLGSDAASVDSNTVLGGNIPQTFKHMMILATVLGSATATLRLTFNNNTAGNYYWQAVKGTTTTVSGESATSDSAITVGDITTGDPSDLSLHVNNYTVSDHRQVHGKCSSPSSGGSNFVLRDFGGKFAVGAAITRIAIAASTGNLKAGSRFTFVGIG